jgi:hypothetical protein
MDYEVNKLADELEQELNPNVMGEDELQGIVGNAAESHSYPVLPRRAVWQ